MNSKLFWESLLFTVVLIFYSCTNVLAAPISNAGASTELLVYAPPVLEDVLSELKTEYQQSHPGITVVYTLKPPGLLQAQLEKGDIADIFISAAPKQIDALEQKNLINPVTRRNIASNKLVLIVRTDSDLGISSFKDMADSSVSAFGLADPEAAPVGQYGIEVFKSLDIWEKIKSKAVITKDGCSIVALVESGKVNAGIVFTTNAATSDKVKIAAYAPEGSHKPIIFPGAVLSKAKQPAVAADFMNFLIDKSNISIFNKYGFLQVDN